MGVIVVLDQIAISLSISSVPLLLRASFGTMSELENPNEFKKLYESENLIIRVLRESKLTFNDEINDNKHCNGCMMPVFSSFYYCSCYDFFLHKTYVELPRKTLGGFGWAIGCGAFSLLFISRYSIATVFNLTATAVFTLIAGKRTAHPNSPQLWIVPKPFILLTNGILKCWLCGYDCSGFSYKQGGTDDGIVFCFRCAVIPHSYMHQANESHCLFYDAESKSHYSACGKHKDREGALHCQKLLDITAMNIL
ncbi:hypothetical protein Gohar_015028 [Gossypium harknessii]|uniref:Uncharacterized protein n=1 Tax=Gossypium harknessii TaxID=34285 RepID=A0A7J9FYZ3_9ROSI|nr:hypothetical protein [Gossypium harknessii]